MNAERESSPPDTTDLLRRILNAVAPAKTSHGFEIACAFVLALATTASAGVPRQEELAAQAMAASREARRCSDDYVLLTVAFAPVLLFLAPPGHPDHNAHLSQVNYS